MQDLEEVKKPKGRRTSRLQRRIDTALAIAGDHPAWISAFLSTAAENDLAIHLDIITNLDGNSIYKSQKKYMLKKVGVFA